MKHNSTIRHVLTASTVSLLVAASGNAAASGFAIVEQGVKNVGSAISGTAAAEDPTAVFYNPAGIMLLKGTGYVVAGHIIQPSAKFSGSATTNPAVGGAPISGGNGGDGGKTGFVPNFYWVTDINENTKFGLGINAPFGLATEYDDGWKGRYHALESDLQSLAINPNFAFRTSDKMSVAAGVTAMYLKATLSNAVDYSTACLGAQPLATCASTGGGVGGAGLVTPGNTATDGSVKIKGDSWGYGYNLALMYEISPTSRIGASYRSGISEDLDGNANFTAPTGPTLPAALSAVLADSGASASVDLPDTLSIGYFRQVSPKMDFMADLTWTKWSSFDELRIKFDNPLKADTVQPENWDDTYKLSVGFNYRYSPKWTWRGGVAYDQTPIQNATDRTPRIPGNNRRWVAAGFTYKASPTMDVDFAYAHLFVSDTPINATDSSFGHNLTGEYKADVNIVSAQLNWSF